MARLRADFVRGTITNNPLAIGDTTLTSASLASLPVVSSPDICVLILDPGSTAPEIVYVTAHSSAATSATISRGQEGSTAKAHIQGTAFAHGATGDDYPSNAFPAAVANGDILYGVAASDEYQALAMTNLGVLVGGASAPAWNAPTTPKTYLRLNAAGTALEWVEVPTIIAADAFEWTKIANRYTANFSSKEMLNNAVLGDILDAGWVSSASVVMVASPTAAGTGDMNSAADATPGYVWTTVAATQHFGSPLIIGGFDKIQSIGGVTGTTPTTITVGYVARISNSGTSATVTLGMSNDIDVVPATSGVIGITCGATNFEYIMDAAAGVSLGVAKDTNWHKIEFVINIAGMTMDIKIDGTVRADDVALAEDVWPKGLYTYTTDTNTGAWQIAQGWVNYD